MKRTLFDSVVAENVILNMPFDEDLYDTISGQAANNSHITLDAQLGYKFSQNGYSGLSSTCYIQNLDLPIYSGMTLNLHIHYRVKLISSSYGNFILVSFRSTLGRGATYNPVLAIQWTMTDQSSAFYLAQNTFYDIDIYYLGNERKVYVDNTLIDYVDTIADPFVNTDLSSSTIMFSGGNWSASSSNNVFLLRDLVISQITSMP